MAQNLLQSLKKQLGANGVFGLGNFGSEALGTTGNLPGNGMAPQFS